MNFAKLQVNTIGNFEIKLNVLSQILLQTQILNKMKKRKTPKRSYI